MTDVTPSPRDASTLTNEDIRLEYIQLFTTKKSTIKHVHLSDEDSAKYTPEMLTIEADLVG